MSTYFSDLTAILPKKGRSWPNLQSNIAGVRFLRLRRSQPTGTTHGGIALSCGFNAFENMVSGAFPRAPPFSYACCNSCCCHFYSCHSDTRRTAQKTPGLLQSKHAGSVLAAFLKDLSLRALGVWEFTEFNLNPRPSLNVPKP